MKLRGALGRELLGADQTGERRADERVMAAIGRGHLVELGDLNEAAVATR